MVLRIFKYLWRQIELILNRLSYDLRWKPAAIIKDDERELRLNFDFVATNLLSKKSDIFFVEIGANDGVRGDPIHRYVRDHGWSGIMIEPLPNVFDVLTENYSSYPAVKLLNVAIGKTDGKQTIYTVQIDPEEFSWASQFSSFRRDIVEPQARHIPDVASRIRESTIDSITFQTLIEKHADGREVDVLQIDTEGFGLEILKMIDFNVIKPSMINFEVANMSREEKNEATRLLLEQGCRITMGNLDGIAYRLSA